MFKTIILTIFLLLVSIPCLAQPSSLAIQPGTSCDVTNVGSLGTNQDFPVDGSRMDFRIHVEGTTVKIRCTFGNVFGAPAPTSSSTVGYEIISGGPDFDAYPFVPPTVDFKCSPESSAAISILICHR